MNIAEIVGKNLRYARKASGLTQKQLADEMNKYQSDYSEYERGKVQLDYEKIVFLCDRLDITPNDLFGYDEWAPERAENRLKEIKTTATGTLRISASDTIFNYALIDKIVRFLNLPLEYAKDGVKNLYEAYFQHSALNKFDLVKLIDADLYKASDPRSFNDYKKLFYLRGKLAQLRSGAFYKTMSQFPLFTGRPEVTNLFLHNPDYRNCFRLWLFLDEFNAGLSLLSQEEQRSVYCAFISLAMISAYVQLGFRIETDASVGKIDENFSLKGFVLTNEWFKVTLHAEPGRIEVLVQCPKIRAQQTTVIELHTNIAEQYGKDNQFVVSLHRTDYNDRAACVVPGNKNSLKDLESIVRCTVFTFEAKREIYDRLCLICGSNALEDKDYFYRCDDCGAVYCFLDDEHVWVNQFNVLSDRGEGTL